MLFVVIHPEHTREPFDSLWKPGAVGLVGWIDGWVMGLLGFIMGYGTEFAWSFLQWVYTIWPAVMRCALDHES